MTTFQAIVYAVISGFCEFLPISSDAHLKLLPLFAHWPEPTGVFSGVLALGGFLAVFIAFRHDWASMISCFLQILIFRKRPMTLDERMPLFLAAATLPLGISSAYLEKAGILPEFSPIMVAAGLAVGGAALWMGESMNRRNKSMFDWNWRDALLAGFVLLFTFLPGLGCFSAVLIVALFRNFNREAAAKFAYFTLGPILMGRAIHQLHELSFHSSSPMEGVSWLSLAVALITSTLAGLLAIGGLMKQIQQKSFRQYVVYRWIMAVGMFGGIWYRGRSAG